MYSLVITALATIWLGLPTLASGAAVIVNDPRLPNPSKVSGHLMAGKPILGDYEDTPCGAYPSWMEDHHDASPLTSLNIPGTHDSATWNYTKATQDSLKNWTGVLPAPENFRCQSQSLFQALGDGIRAFDLRVGWLPGGKKIGFFHASALLDAFVTLEDVFYGFYQYLVDYPTETLLVSLKVDNTTFAPVNKSDPTNGSLLLQQMIYDLLTDSVGKKFWIQNGTTPLGTLNTTRGKITLLNRLDLSLLDPKNSSSIGIPFPPSVWADNNANFTIKTNASTGTVAYIEDYYEVGKGGYRNLTGKVAAKLNATVSHLMLSTNTTKSSASAQSLFITFASAQRDVEGLTPQLLALGNKTVNGVNQDLLPFLKKNAEKRMGLLFLDWYANVTDLVPTIVEAQV